MLKYKYEDLISKSENISIIKASATENEPKHIHEFIELVYIVSGTSVHTVQDTSYTAKTGDLLFINYNQEHSFESLEEFTYINILITPEFMTGELINSENIYDIFSIFLSDGFRRNLNSEKNLISFHGNEDIEVNSFIKNMLEEFQNKNAGYKSILNGYMRILFAKIIRKLQGSDSVEKNYISKITPEIMSYIDQNCFRKISLGEIAQISFYNPAYFSRIFKEFCGQSFTAYIQKKRTDEARNLLKTTDFTVDIICEKVGYSDKKQFYKVFKEQVGLTPNEFRKAE